jgi:nucleoside recognition membrane protein YjiH
MYAFRRASGVWTFLVAIFIGLGAAVVAYLITNMALAALLTAPVAMLVMVAICQWI